MTAKNQPVTDERLKEVLKDYPTKDYLEDRLDLLKKEISIDIDDKFDRFDEKMDEKLARLQKNILSALGSTVVSHEQRIVKLEETVFPQPK